MRMTFAVVGALFAAALISNPANAASCPVEADKKKLTGAARTTFVTKCLADVKAACEKHEAVTDFKRTKLKQGC
jgi:ribonuclease HII